MDTSTVEALRLLPRPTDFVQVPVELIRRLGPNAAILLSRMHWRFEGGWRLLHEHGGRHWWQATLNDLGDETGLTVKQVRGALDALIALGAVVREKHRLGGKSDHSYSYRLRSADEAEALLSTDLPERAKQSTSDLPQRANLDLPQRANLLSVEDIETRHNADGDDEGVDKSGPFVLTPARRKLIADIMIDVGQGYAVPVYMSHLEMQTWGAAEREIARWCGIREAHRNGKTRSDINELLVLAGLAPVTDEQWREYLRRGPVGITSHPDRCHDAGSGYCLEHGERMPE